MSQAEAGTGEEEIGRIPSLIPGLDQILCGGFLRGGLYLVQGPPGMGKTVLANQIIYRRAAEGSRALFLTVLGENHGRMLAHLRPMRFFDPSFIPNRITYLSAYQALEDEGLEGITALVRREVLAHKATLLVLDGVSALEAKASTAFQMKKFTHELQTLASATGCTMLLLTTAAGARTVPEHTMVDGLIELLPRSFGVRRERRLLVHKVRGSDFLEGEHAFRISQDGVSVFPRIEAVLAMPSIRRPPPRTRMTSGIPSLDAVFEGGMPEGTMTAVVGPSGSGKTTLGIQFLSASNTAEPGLLFGCYEPPERLRWKAETMGQDLSAAERRGDVEILWHPVGEHILDELAHRLLEAVRRRGVRRLLIDGVSGFQQATLEPDRVVRFWSALSNELRALGVTTLHTVEMPELVGADLRMPLHGISSLAESMVVLRYVELKSRLYRLISLFKVREGAFDPTIREFSIAAGGITLGRPFEGVEAVLSGRAREVALKGASAAPSQGDTPAPPVGDTGPPW